MVLTFKLYPADTNAYSIDKVTFERITRNSKPWYVEGAKRATVQRYGVCPWCDNPVQLRGLITNGPAKRRPDGAHVNRRVDGFAIFDGHRLENCPYQRRGRPYEAHERLPPSETSLKIRRLAVEQFDRALLILKQDLGINLSNRLAQRLLASFLKNSIWAYTGASLRNVPWMLALFAPSLPLKGQYLREGSELYDIMASELGENGQVPVSNGYGFFCTNHQVRIERDQTIRESIDLLVSDFSRPCRPADAPIVLLKTIHIDHAKFERLAGLPANHPNRDHGLLAIAQELGAEIPADILDED